MAQFYTQEEAAQRLGMSLEEFKRRLKTEWTTIQPLRDGATLRYRSSVIDELARSLGEASDPGLAPGGLAGSGSAAGDSDDEILPLTASESLFGKPAGPAKQDDEPLLISDEEDILTGNFGRSKGDSDVRLDFSTGPNLAPGDGTNPTEEFAVDLSGPSSAIIKPSSGSGKLSAPKSGTKLAGPDSGRIPSPTGGGNANPLGGPPRADDSSSEFELSLDSSNDSLELEITGDSSAEIDLGDLGGRAAGPQSGLNLGRPADSGLSLEKKGPKTGPLNQNNLNRSDDESIDDFELSLDADDSDPALRGPKSAVMSSTGPASDSEFELALDEDSGVAEAIAGELQQEANRGDIFETDFELPAAEDSDSELVAAEANSDFDLDVTEAVEINEESNSQVLLVEDEPSEIEEEEAPRKKRAKNLAAAFGDEDLEEGGSASGALRGVRRSDDDDDDDDLVRSGANVVAVPATWGALPAVVLGLTMPLVIIGTLVSYENLRSMWGYHQTTKPASVLAKPLAEALGSKLPD